MSDDTSEPPNVADASSQQQYVSVSQTLHSFRTVDLAVDLSFKMKFLYSKFLNVNYVEETVEGYCSLMYLVMEIEAM